MKKIIRQDGGDAGNGCSLTLIRLNSSWTTLCTLDIPFDLQSSTFLVVVFNASYSLLNCTRYICIGYTV
jgi:hypothetical protein